MTYSRLILILLLTGILTANVCQATDKNQDCELPFEIFLSKMNYQAIKNGISPKIVAKALLNTKYLVEVVELDNNQKAFRVSFTEFSNKSVNEYRLENGRKKIKKYQGLFDDILKTYGIPPEVIVAFWAMETDYGVVQGNFHTLSALGSLANNCRRSELFKAQFLAAIELVENKILDPESSVGAWAGEFGQIQMLPSDILAFGVDGDGDGKVELDKSPYDTLLTAAELISSKGWKPQQPWFEEVELNSWFPFREAGLGRDRSVLEWLDMGIKPRNLSFPASYNNLSATLILPQGRKGPKFLAFENFNVFMKWNNSFMYSTTAAYLANRLRGDPSFLSSSPSDILNFDQMIQLQEILVTLGYEVGNIDGILGLKTRQSVRKIQIQLGFPADSWPTILLLERLISI